MFKQLKEDMDILQEKQKDEWTEEHSSIIEREIELLKEMQTEMTLDMKSSKEPYTNLNGRPNHQTGSCRNQTLDGRQHREIDHLVNFSDKIKKKYD